MQDLGDLSPLHRGTEDGEVPLCARLLSWAAWVAGTFLSGDREGLSSGLGRRPVSGWRPSWACCPRQTQRRGDGSRLPFGFRRKPVSRLWGLWGFQQSPRTPGLTSRAPGGRGGARGRTSGSTNGAEREMGGGGDELKHQVGSGSLMGGSQLSRSQPASGRGPQDSGSPEAGVLSGMGGVCRRRWTRTLRFHCCRRSRKTHLGIFLLAGSAGTGRIEE